MEIAISDCERPYNKSKLQECIEKFIKSDKNAEFIMTCFNKEAIETMLNLKKVYPDIKFSVINTLKEHNPALLPHYIYLYDYEKVPQKEMSLKLNNSFRESSDAVIYCTKGSISVTYKNTKH